MCWPMCWSMPYPGPDQVIFPNPTQKFGNNSIQTLSYAEGFSPLQMDSNGNITALQPILFPSDQFPALQHDARSVPTLHQACTDGPESTTSVLIYIFRRGFEESLLAKLDQSL